MGVFFEKNGFTIHPIASWELTAEGAATASKGFDRIVSGHINTFECRAKKIGAKTELVFDIDLTLYLGIADKKTLKTIPVAYTLERTDISFTREKFEQFTNQAVEEVIKKAFAL